MSTTTKDTSLHCIQAHELAVRLLADHGLADWAFAFNRSKRQMGCCRFDPKVIEVLRHFVERNTPDLILDTLLHEIAHAMVGPGHGHDAVWKEMCLRVGAKPERLSNEPDMPQGRWQAICGSCGMRHHKHRRPKRMKGWFCQWQTELELLVDCHHLLEADRPPLFPEVGERLGDFQLLVELGRGARGRVFLASQAALADRHVICKITPREGDEHLSLARLQHAHIVPLYFVQEFPERHLQGLCMPYLGGLPLAAVLANLSHLPQAARDGRQFLNQIEQAQPPVPVPLPTRGPIHRFLTRASSDQVVCWLGCCLADALHYAHERALIHLDVKPNNILLAADGQPMLLDFHLARAPLMPGEPAPGWLGGTPGYMAPEHEQALMAVSESRPVSARVDGRADVYSLGLVLYEALGGPMPLPPHRSPRRLLRHNPRVSRGLADILAKCLKPDPARRYDSAADLAADLRCHLANQPLQGVPNRSWIERWRKWRRRSRAFSCSTLLMVLLLGAAAASRTRETFLIWQRRHRTSTDTLEGQQSSSLLRCEEPRLGVIPLDEALSRQSDDFWVHYYRGLYSYHLQRPREALADFNACIVLAPERGECYFNRALAHVNLDQTESALRDYDQALRLEPHLARAAFNRGILHLPTLRGTSASGPVLGAGSAMRLAPWDGVRTFVCENYNSRPGCYEGRNPVPG